MLDAYVFDLERTQVASRLGHQRRDTLDRVHLARDMGQHRRLVTAAGANFKHLRQVASGAQELGHTRDHIGL